MYEPYLLVTQIIFPKAKYVVERFHYTTYIMDALDDIRIRLQKLYGEKSKEYKLLKNNNLIEEPLLLDDSLLIDDIINYRKTFLKKKNSRTLL